jgi:hypothetical protein
MADHLTKPSCLTLKDQRTAALLGIILPHFVNIFDVEEGILFQP